MRAERRVEADWAVDCETPDTFLYAAIANISALGIFVRTESPFAIGTLLSLRFLPRDGEPFQSKGRVQWINPVVAFGDNINPGMGIQFIDLSPEERERLVEAIHTIAYLRSDPPRS